MEPEGADINNYFNHSHIMLSTLKRIIGIEPAPFNQDAGETVLDEGRMPLEDRMAWRRKMVYSGVKEVMTSFGIMGKWYKFRISQVDDRGHVYVIMIDVMKDFAVRPGSKVKEIGRAHV